MIAIEAMATTPQNTTRAVGFQMLTPPRMANPIIPAIDTAQATVPASINHYAYMGTMIDRQRASRLWCLPFLRAVKHFKRARRQNPRAVVRKKLRPASR